MEKTIGEYFNYRFNTLGEKGIGRDQFKKDANNNAFIRAFDPNGQAIIKQLSEDKFFDAIQAITKPDGTFDKDDLDFISSVFRERGKGSNQEITPKTLDRVYQNLPSIAIDQLVADLSKIKYTNNKNGSEEKGFRKEELEFLSKWLKGQGKIEDLFKTTYQVRDYNKGENQLPFTRTKNVEKLNPEVKQEMAGILDSIVENIDAVDKDKDGNVSLLELALLITNPGMGPSKEGITRAVTEKIASSAKPIIPTDNRRPFPSKN